MSINNNQITNGKKLEKNVTIDDVLDFIEKNGEVYNYRIKKALSKFDNRGASVEEIVSKKRSMYERLSKL